MTRDYGVKIFFPQSASALLDRFSVPPAVDVAGKNLPSNGMYGRFAAALGRLSPFVFERAFMLAAVWNDISPGLDLPGHLRNPRACQLCQRFFVLGILTPIASLSPGLGQMCGLHRLCNAGLLT